MCQLNFRLVAMHIMLLFPFLDADPLLDSLVAQKETVRRSQNVRLPERQVFLRERDPNSLYWGGDGYYPYYYTGHPYYDLGNTPFLWCYYQDGQYVCARKLYVR